jgi:probable F420-dependent oxidoreductase
MSTQPLASSEDEVNPFRGQRAHFAAAVDRARLGKVGLWTFDFDVQPWAAVRPTLELLEKEGVGTVWFPELFGRDALTQAGLILGATERMVAANGILRTDRYSATAAAAGAMTLADAYPGRHVLGLGVGPFPDGDPFALLGAFLDGLAQASTSFPPPNTPPPIVVAAYGPRMCQFGADRTAGLHTYLVTVEHTARVREQVGAAPFLAVEQAVVIGEGAAARDAGRLLPEHPVQREQVQAPRVHRRRPRRRRLGPPRRRARRLRSPGRGGQPHPRAACRGRRPRGCAVPRHRRRGRPVRGLGRSRRGAGRGLTPLRRT